MLKLPYITFSYLCFLLLCITNTLSAQHYISKYDVRWGFFHPIAACKIKHHLPEAMAIYKEVKAQKLLDTLESGGKLDAFRHVYTMAYLSRFVKTKKLKKLGIAHEKGNKLQFKKQVVEFGERPDSLACDMDLRNNEVGFLIGTQTRDNTNAELKAIVIQEIITGNAWYLRRNGEGNYVNCNNELLNMELYHKKWFVPKCLIKTNE